MSSAEDISPRQFQTDIIQFAKHRNTIVYLETGSGKTHIAFMLMKEKVHQILGSWKNGAKRSVFLANSVYLVDQQRTYIEKHMPPEVTVGAFVGSRGVDFWVKSNWDEQMEQNHILVFTAMVFRNALAHKMVKAEDFNVIVVDECHRAVDSHPYREIMGLIFESTIIAKRPLILGLTACVLNDKATAVKNRENLRKLEKTFRAAVVGPREAPESFLYATSAREVLLVYKGESLSKYSFLGKIDDAARIASAMNEEFKLSLKSIRLPNIAEEPILAEKNVFSDLKRSMAEWKIICADLGFVGAKIYGDHVIGGELAAAKKGSSVKYKTFFDQFDVLFSSICGEIDESLMGMGDERAQFQFGSSKKFQRLVELLKALGPRQLFMSEARRELYKDAYADVRGIVFVKRRALCEVLQMMLANPAVDGLKHLRSAKIVGVNAPASVFKNKNNVGNTVLSIEEQRRLDEAYRVWQEDCKKCDKVLSKFRTGKLNLLVATDVLEEGIDVPCCNLIVRYDSAESFRAYVQSRGRARAKDAIYVFMTSETDKQSNWRTIEGYHSAEFDLVEMCAERSVPTEEETMQSFSEDCLPSFSPYGPTGPKIHANSASDIVTRYVSRYGPGYKPFYSMNSYAIDPNLGRPVLTKKGYHGPLTSSMPRRPEEVDMLPEFENSLSLDLASEVLSMLPPELVRMYLRFPTVTRISETHPIVTGDVKGNLKLAKFDVCLKACECLFRAGFLDKNLIPRKLETRIRTAEDDPEDPDDEMDGMTLPSSGSMDCYENQPIVPHVLARSLRGSRPKPGNALYLYLVKIQTEKLMKNFAISEIWQPETSSLVLGMLSGVPLPLIDEFTLYPKQATVRLSIDFLKKGIYLDDEQLTNLERFYADVMIRHVMELDDVFYDLDFSRQTDGVLFVPVWRATSGVALDYVEESLKSLKTWEKIRYNPREPEIFLDAVVRPMVGSKQFHVVLNVQDDMSPDSKIHDQNLTFRKYLKDAYRYDVRYAGQPMLRVSFQTRNLDMFKPRFDEKTTSGKREVSYLVPEVCFLSPVPATLWLQLLLIPSFHRRLNCIYKAIEYRHDINIGFSTSELEFDKPPPVEESGLVSMTKETALRQTVSYPAPPLDAVLEALTAKAAGELMDFEGYETVGDAVLKLCSSVHLFLERPSETEGQLTSAKVNFISNDALLKANMGITAYWNAASFLPRETWLPPLFSKPSFVEECFLKSNRTKNDWLDAELRTLVKTKGLASLTKEDVEKGMAGELYTGKPHPLQSVYLSRKKSFADCAEAVAGMYSVWNGLSSAWNFYKDSLGLKFCAFEDLAGKVSSPLVPRPQEEMPRLQSSFAAEKAALIKRVETVQKRLKYTFKDPMFLVQALTHPSYAVSNSCTKDFDRLEFLGDAVLDYLIVLECYHKKGVRSPEMLTDLRSALTNNATLAALAVENKFDRYMLVLAEPVVNSITNFADLVRSEDWKKPEFLLKTHDDGTVELLIAPKSLADMFEALVGAVFLDSGLDLKKVWDVFGPIFRDVIEIYAKDVPLNAVKVVMEKLGKFLPAHTLNDGRFAVDCQFRLRGKNPVVRGLAASCKNAKLAAAMEAVRRAKLEGFSMSLFVIVGVKIERVAVTMSRMEDRICVLCCREAKFFSIGPCDHPVCLECSTRMRVLCEKKVCPICRKVLKKVVFTKKLQSFDKEFKNKKFELFDKEYGIGFEDGPCCDAYDKLLEFRCLICPSDKRNTSFENFVGLQRHVNREHSRFFCDLCVKNLKLFNHELRTYAREELTRHRTQGDPDDTSHRGHPLCKFCDERFLDNDELYRHVRRDHYFCHFCDSDESRGGKSIIFNNYQNLRQHFLTDHYLCEEGSCKEEKFVNAFSSELDLKAHKMKEHMGQASKAVAKQTRTLELEFSISRTGQGARGPPGGANGRGGRRRMNARNAEEEEARFREEFEALGAVGGPPPHQEPEFNGLDTENVADFPSLSAATGGEPDPVRRGPNPAQLFRRQGPEASYLGRVSKNMMREEDFPSLNSTVPNKPTQTNVNITISGRHGAGATKKSGNGVSVEYSRSVTTPIPASRPSMVEGAKPRVTRISSSQNIRLEMPTGMDAPPVVVSQANAPKLEKLPKKSEEADGQWVSVVNAKKPVKPPPSDGKWNTVPNGGDAFPSLGPPEKRLPSHSFAAKAKQSANSGSAWSKKSNTQPEPKKPEEVSKKQPTLVLSKTRPHALDEAMISHKAPDAGSAADFPSLGATSSLASGGIGGARRLPPPPGFDTKSKRDAKASKTVTDVTFTNSSGQKFSLNPPREYHKPRDFDARSDALTTKIRKKALRGDGDRLNDFMTLSSAYLAGAVSAREYYSRCIFYFGDCFAEIFPEFLALLPNIARQAGLLEAHEEVEEQRIAVEEDFFSCPLCRQVLLARDYEGHADFHGEEFERIYQTRVGYAGGSTQFPTYRSLGDHTETVEVVYETEKMNYENILEMFWKHHNPRASRTRQYMSAIFYYDDEQRKAAEESLKKEAAKKPGIKTLILPVGTFYEAEDYHQKYLLQQHANVLVDLDIDPESIVPSHLCARLNGYLNGFSNLKSFEAEKASLKLPPNVEAYVEKCIKRGCEPGFC
ncbi:unnamed protein product [Notodromas monacha]|uniref:peptide-methionine (S)-S-oxide reductase n=1 Tax=Notodromas monacha TaxID=399045 RepID=A0A7R9BEL3_9CRUS|nr:unnamed protein product [Notodromas monacha]CAG0913962.1 unnamed protein product [Notodromas monacha]